MTLPHFFLKHQVIAQQSSAVFALELSQEDLKHAQVLRLSAGEHIAVIDASSDYFECEVVSLSKSALEVTIAQRLNVPKRASVTLVQGLAKGEKMDTILRQATELGIDEFVPLLSSRSIVKLDEKKTATRMRRWISIAKHAAMQSGRSSLPQVFEPLTLSALAKNMNAYDAIFICWEEVALSQSIAQALSQLRLHTEKQPFELRLLVVVGPEGGLSQEEVDTLMVMHSQSFLVSLGPSILRTETAGVVAPALLFYELER